MKLTLWNRLKLCFEILTIRSGHKHSAFEKDLSSFKRGFRAGVIDSQYAVHEKVASKVNVHLSKGARLTTHQVKFDHPPKNK